MRILSPCLLVSSSPCPLVPLSPCPLVPLSSSLRVSVSLWLRSRKKIDTHGSEIRWRKLGAESLIGHQSRFARASEKQIELDQVLIGKSVSRVVCDSQRPVQIGSRHLRRQSVKLHHEQAEPPHVGRPATQMAHQILFQLVRRNLLAQIRESPGRSPRARSARVIGGRKIRAVVI
jgi:hypothetical protein